jgi:aspartyl-tRNA(Asn)/glutamyl-tRNA(Gln) amidotransferase subunit C
MAFKSRIILRFDHSINAHDFGQGQRCDKLARLRKERYPMSVTTSQLADVATLARLQLDAEQAEPVTQAINQILGLVDQLQALDLQAVVSMAHPRDEIQRLRADIVTETNQREAFQALAPAAEDGLYVVPPVIE